MLYDRIDNGYQLQRLFIRCKRGDSFTAAGFDALFNYLDELGHDMDVDPVGLCCDFSEWTAEELAEEEMDEEFIICEVTQYEGSTFLVHNH